MRCKIKDEMKLKIAHVINVTEINESKKSSYLHIAQPVTMKTMTLAKKYAKNRVDIELFVIKHKSENVAVDPDFKLLPDIEQYAYEFIDTLKSNNARKPLPRLSDIINPVFSNSEADYVIYTNLDIGLQPNFYLRVKELIDKGYDAITINRVDIDKFHENILLDDTKIDLICSLKGLKHPGIDCVVFRREIIPKLKLNNVMIGFPPVGQVLKTQVENHSKRQVWIKNERLTFHIGQDKSWSVGEKKHPYWLENEKEAQGLYIKQFTQKNNFYDNIKEKLKFFLLNKN